MASPVEPYNCIEHGVTGYLAKSEAEWVEYLSKLIENESFRVKMGKKANKFVRKNYSVEKVSADYIKKLEKFL